MKETITSLTELEEFARQYLARLVPSSSGATLIALSGDLGAGKTALTKAFAKVFGIKEHITSPTFVLAKHYTIEGDSRFTKLIHIDAYRLTEGDDLTPLRFDELLSVPEHLIVLEWPERVTRALPKGHRKIHMALVDDAREIAHDGYDKR